MKSILTLLFLVSVACGAEKVSYLKTYQLCEKEPILVQVGLPDEGVDYYIPRVDGLTRGTYRVWRTPENKFMWQKVLLQPACPDGRCPLLPTGIPLPPG